MLTTKLAHPQLRREIVQRSRLYAKLDASLAKLILVAAPAGFGKTTLVIDWLKRKQKQFSWLSLDSQDNDAPRFLQYVVAALQTQHPTLGKDILPLLQQSAAASSEAVVTLLANALNQLNEPTMLVLDDYHCIEEPAIHLAVSFFLDHLPPNVQLILSTRVDPLLPLARYRARGELVEIRERDLRFTFDEVKEFFNRTVALPLREESIAALESRTEGWIAGLQMAAVSAHEANDAEAFVKTFTGSSRYVVDYLLEEVLSRQSESVQNFLLDISILPRFNAELCEAMTQQQNAHEMLQNLDAHNLFLVALDDRREWYRFHHLFADLLSYRLRRLHHDRVDELHHRASEWFERRGDFHEAIAQAMRMSNFAHALTLLDAHALQFVARSQLASLLNIVKKIPRQQLNDRPMLLVSVAWSQLLTLQSRDLESTLASAALSLETTTAYSATQKASVRGHMQTIRAFILRIQNKLNESIEVSRDALSALPPNEILLRGLLRFNIGRVSMKLGLATQAAEFFESSIPDHKEAGNYYSLLAALGHRGALFAITHSCHLAKARLEESLSYVERANLVGLPAAGYVFYQLGKVLYQLNELDEAGKLLDKAIELGELGNDPEVLCNALYTLAWVCYARGETKRGNELVERGDAFERQGTARIFESNTGLHRVYIALMERDHRAVAAWEEERKFNTNDEFTTVAELEALILIRIHLDRKANDKALRLITWLREKSRERERAGILLLLDLLEATALFNLKRESEAFALLDASLERAWAWGFIRAILDWGMQTRELVHAYRRHNKSSGVLAELLLLMNGDGGPQPIPKFAQTTNDPLTEREQEVLHLLHQGNSNKQIAEKMFVSVNTVKTHIKHLYAKLEVVKRDEALRRGIELGLLRTDEEL